eukprot:5970301-Alexandrium_andersonii.AAC.1
MHSLQFLRIPAVPCNVRGSVARGSTRCYATVRSTRAAAMFALMPDLRASPEGNAKERQTEPTRSPLAGPGG